VDYGGITWAEYRTGSLFDGLVPVKGYKPHNRPPEEVAIVEKAAAYGAAAAFFEAGRQRTATLAPSVHLRVRWSGK